MASIPPVVQHPRWCAGEPLCTADTGRFAASHRSETYDFSAPAINIQLTLMQATPGWLTDPYLIMVLSAITDTTDRLGVTVSVTDAWRFADQLTSLLESAS